MNTSFQRKSDFLFSGSISPEYTDQRGTWGMVRSLYNQRWTQVPLNSVFWLSTPHLWKGLPFSVFPSLYTQVKT